MLSLGAQWRILHIGCACEWHGDLPKEEWYVCWNTVAPWNCERTKQERGFGYRCCRKPSQRTDESCQIAMIGLGVPSNTNKLVHKKVRQVGRRPFKRVLDQCASHAMEELVAQGASLLVERVSE